MTSSNKLAWAVAPMLLALPVTARGAAPSDLKFSFEGGAEYQFDQQPAGNSGDFSVLRLRGGLGIQAGLTSTLNLDVGVSYGLDSYDFSDPGLDGTADPWDDINTFTLGARFTLSTDDDWTVFGGPILRFSGETGADFGDTITGGGMIGASVRVSDELLIGGGVGLITELEDAIRFFPVIVLNWQITDAVSLRNSSGGAGRAGLELVWEASDAWSFALGASYEHSRFRLDDDAGAHSNGIGEDEGVPITLRATYTLSPNVQLNATAGATTGGNLRLEDSGGHQLADEDYDNAFFVGFSGSIRF